MPQLPKPASEPDGPGAAQAATRPRHGRRLGAALASVPVVAAAPHGLQRGGALAIPGQLVHPRSVVDAREAAHLANGRYVDRVRRPTAHSVAWRDLTYARAVAAPGSDSAGATTACLILGSAVTHGTADSYNRSRLVFSDFCDSNGWPSLPTTEAAITCYFAFMCERA